MPLADSTRFCINKPFVRKPAKACVASGIVGVNARASGKAATTRSEAARGLGRRKAHYCYFSMKINCQLSNFTHEVFEVLKVRIDSSFSL